MNITKKKISTIVVITIAIGASTGVAGYFLGLGGALTGAVTGAACGAVAVFLLR